MDTDFVLQLLMNLNILHTYLLTTAKHEQILTDHTHTTYLKHIQKPYGNQSKSISKLQEYEVPALSHHTLFTYNITLLPKPSLTLCPKLCKSKSKNYHRL